MRKLQDTRFKREDCNKTKITYGIPLYAASIIKEGVEEAPGQMKRAAGERKGPLNLHHPICQGDKHVRCDLVALTAQKVSNLKTCLKEHEYKNE